MKSRILLLMLIPFLIGCAAFKQLEPDPDVVSQEGPYIELKDDDDHFELDRGKRYYIEFPAPVEDNFYLVITVSDKNNVVSGLADRFDDDKGPLSRVLNEAPKDAEEDVYPVKRSVQKFYWVIERVDLDMLLQMTYRYLPQWRYKFETQYESFQNILAENRIDRTTYENIGGSVSLRNFNFSKTQQELSQKSSNLEALFSQLSSIEKLFPASILNSQDEAYRNYLTLKEDIQLELTFQKNYATALKVFETEMGTRNSIPAFASAIPGFLDFLKEKEKYPANIINEANRVFDARLGELTPYYDDLVQKKNDFDPVELSVEDVDNLYKEIGSAPSSDYKALSDFIRVYNQKATALKDVREGMDRIRRDIQSKNSWPDNNYFSSISAQLNDLTKSMPAAGFSGQGKYANVRCAGLLNNAIHALRGEAIRASEDYKRAQALVVQLNRYANDHSYRQMVQLINRNKDLDFLAGMYADLDQKSLQSQQNQITSALKQQNWKQAEDGLRLLHRDNDFINYNKISATKSRTVKALEDTLLARVERITRQRVDAFVNEKYNVVDDVEGLYQDPVFEPVWNLTFTSGSQNDLIARKERLNNRLKTLKENEFPAKAIEFLYKDFVKDINNNGVMKARAIVTHGQHYKGSNSKIRNLVAECDPWASKWLTKEVEYRKIYAMPTTTNPSGVNTYVFRVNIRIPTDARFPAYDVNIKLPKAVAENAATSSWYEQMTMNKELLKPEGRFTINAPGPENDYTALITPLQVIKDSDSVLEVRFKHNSFKVFEISLMAQKPILRKN